MTLQECAEKINKEVPCFAPVFIEKDGTEMYSVEFQFISMQKIGDGKFVMSGLLSV